MNSPALAILWELWSRNRWANLTVALALPVFALFNSSVIGEWLRIAEVLLFLFSIVILFWTFSYVEPDSRGRHGGFPARMFTLPAQTVFLAAVPMIFGAATVATVYWLWTKLIFAAWGAVVPPPWMRIHLLMLSAMLFSLQALVWSLYRFPWIRLASILVTFTILGVIGLAMPGDEFTTMSEGQVLITLSVASAVAFVAAIAGVSRDRRGEWDGWTQRLIDRLQRLLPRRRNPFSSGAVAQVWFEWRGKAFFLSALLALPMVLAVMLYPIPTALHFDAVMSASAYANLPLLTLFMAWCLGMALAKTDYWSRERELSSFVSARPLTDGDIVIAKLNAAGLIILVASFVFAALAVPAFNVPHWLSDADTNWPSWSQFKSQHPQLLLNLSHPLVLLTAFAVTWTTMLDGLAIGFRRQTLVVIQSVARVSLFLAALILVSLLAKRPGGLKLLTAILPWASALLIAWKIASTLFYFTRARPLYSRKQLVSLAILWALTWACVAGTASLVWTDIATFDRVIIFIATVLAPGSALPRCAINLHRNRHQ